MTQFELLSLWERMNLTVDQTFRHATRITALILGHNIRYLSEHALDHLNHLRLFDASRVTLDQLLPSARCVLARYIQQQQKVNPRMTVLPPKAENCDCIHDFILLLVNQKAESAYIEQCEDNREERCQFSECDVVQKFRFPSVDSEKKFSAEELVPNIVETSDLFDTHSDGNTDIHRLPHYVHRHPADSHPSALDNQNQAKVIKDKQH
jgi:hypothetical protein